MNSREVQMQENGLSTPARYWAMLAICAGVCLSVLDGVIANVALPTIAKDLHATPASSIWVINAYQVSMMISLLSFASIGGIWGYKKIYLSGLILFTFTSIGCFFSDSMLTLTIARAFQGFAAAAIVSVNSVLLRMTYPPKILAKGIGVNALVVSVSAVAGPTIASAILSVAHWPWLFAVNIPISLLAIFFSYKYLPNNSEPVKDKKFDRLSAIMNALTFGLVILLIEGFTHKLNSSVIIGVFIALLVSAYFFVRREKEQSAPIFPVDLLRIPTFSISIVIAIISFLAQMMAMVLLPFFFQGVLGKTEVVAGLLLTPLPLATMISAPLAGILVSRISGKILSSTGLILFAIGLFLLAILPTHPTDVDIIWRMFVCGFGFGLFQTPNNTAIILSVPVERSGGASGMLSMSRLLGQATGAALGALMLSRFADNAMHISFHIAAVIAFIAGVVSLIIKPKLKN